MKKVLCVIAILVLLGVIHSIHISQQTRAQAPETLKGEALWESLPPELLPEVAEGIKEEISSLEDDLKRVQEIYWEKVQK